MDVGQGYKSRRPGSMLQQQHDGKFYDCDDSYLSPAEIPNPFVHRIQLSTFDKIKIAVMSVSVFPLRTLLVMLTLLLAWPIAFICLIGTTDGHTTKPMTGWRRLILHPIIVSICRMVYFWGGFYWIKVKGRKASVHEAPIIVMAPHTSYFDSIVVVYLDMASIVAKSESGEATLFGTLTRYTQPVFVSREDPNSRQNTIREIRRRATSKENWPQILVFPEGTCTNGSSLITFKPGAFIPGVPVQPVCIRYPNRLDTVTWTWDGPGALKLFWLTVCQFYTNIQIEFLPVYTPDPTEVADPKLFASNVRKVMARHMQLPITDHTFEDCRVMAIASKMYLSPEPHLEFHKLNRRIGIKWENAVTHLRYFAPIASISTNNNITIQRFADLLEVPVSDHVSELFSLYEHNTAEKQQEEKEKQLIDFREYVLGFTIFALAAGSLDSDEVMRIVFAMYYENDDQQINRDGMIRLLYFSFRIPQDQAIVIWQEIHSYTDNDNDDDKNTSDYITYDQFSAYSKHGARHPTLCRIYNSDYNGNASSLSLSHLAITNLTNKIPNFSRTVEAAAATFKCGLGDQEPTTIDSENGNLSRRSHKSH